MPSTPIDLRPARSVSVLLAALALTAISPVDAAAQGPQLVQNPSHTPRPAPRVIDFRRLDTATPKAPGVRFSDLDAHRRAVEPSEPGAGPLVHDLPDGMTQIGGMVVPEGMLDGAAMVPDVAMALTDGSDPVGGSDIGKICAFPEEVPPGVYDYDHRPGGETPRFHTVYLNFVGVPEGLMTGGENSAENISSIARSGHPYPVYGGGEEKAIAVAQAVAADFEDWAVRVVYLERPPKVLPYTMAMVGGHYSDTTAGPSGGVATLDCEDYGQRNVCYAFQNGAPATSQANVVSQEIGHSLGLGHTSAPDSVMAAGYAMTQGGDLGFNETCANTIQVSGQSAACTGVNRCHCGVPDQQHDWLTLSTTFAPAGVDTVEPTISLLQPADGDVFQTEDVIRVEFEPWDDIGGYGWGMRLYDSTDALLVDQVDYDRALEFDLVGLPPDVYTVTAYIQDHADHVATHTITFTVEGEAALDTGGSDDGQDSADDQGSGDDDDGDGSDDGSSGPDLDSDGTDEGCSCITGAPGPVSGLWLLVVLGLARRHSHD